MPGLCVEPDLELVLKSCQRAPSWLPTQAVGVKKCFFFEMGNKEMLIVKYCVIMPYPSYEESVIRKTLWLFDPQEIIIKTAMQDEMKRAFVSFHSCHDSTELLMPRRNKEKGPCACQRLKAACFFSFIFFWWTVTALVEVVASQTSTCKPFPQSR